MKHRLRTSRSIWLLIDLYKSVLIFGWEQKHSVVAARGHRVRNSSYSAAYKSRAPPDWKSVFPTADPAKRDEAIRLASFTIGLSTQLAGKGT